MLSKIIPRIIPLLLRSLAALALVTTAPAVSAQPAPDGPAVRVDDDGTVHMPAMSVPVSSFLSPEGKAYLAEHLQQVQRPAMLQNASDGGIPLLLAGYLARQKALFRIDRQDTAIAGVHAYIYTPKAGIAAANAKRVLIDLHGGGFSGCFPGCAELESMPVAALGRIKVISLDYREGPEHQFPAASEDVAAVYRALLKTYPAANIGIYGCSAGGMLTGMSVAWFQRHGLPRPGAIGIFCAGATVADIGFGGDAAYTAAPLGEGRPAPPLDARSAKPAGPPPLGYLAGANPNDPSSPPERQRTSCANFLRP